MTRLLLALLLLLPAAATADPGDVVDAETLIASPNGRYYVILQQDGALEIVRRGVNNPPARTRVGDVRPKMNTLRSGATAAEVSRATGLTHGIQPETGDAIIGNTKLRDRLDRMRVFDDGSGFVARYASSPSEYDDLEPVRAQDGSDEGLIKVEQKAIGEDRILASFVHLYTRKDALFWGDSKRKIVMMVGGGTELEVTPQSGARLKDRESGQPPRLVAWSYEDKKTVPAPFEALVDRMRSADPNEGLVAYLLARDLDLARITPALADLVHDPNVPHPTRVHAAAALHAQGDGRADSLILATARGTTGPGPLESPLLFGAEGAGPKAVRSWAVAILPITHPEVAPDVLLSVVRDPDVGSSANTALAEGPWPTADWTVPALFRAAHDLDREPKERAAASRLLAVNAPTSDAEAPEEHPLWAMYSWLSADPDPQVHKPILQALPSLADDVAIPRLAGVLRSTDATDAQLRDAAWGLARRSWSSKVAVEALLQIAGDPDGGPSAAAALATLWRIDDPRVSGILIHAAATAGATGEAALHSAFIAARRSNDREAWVIGLDRLPPRKDRVGQALRRTLGVLDPKRIVWAP